MGAAQLIEKYGIMLTVSRAGVGGSYIEGKWMPTPSTTFAVKASVQPVNGKDMKMLPQGANPEEWLKVYTVAPLQTKQIGKQADRFTYKDAQYDVSLVKTYEIPGTGLNHTMSMCGRVTND